MEILQHGAKGQQVLDLQCALTAEGVFDGDLDGCFGPATEAAVRAFQTGHSLPVSGSLDEVTGKALKLPRSPVTMPCASGITPEVVASILPEARRADVALNLPHVLNALVQVGLTSAEFIAMALATIRVEASLFLPVSERQSTLNTSPGGKPFDLYDNRAGIGNKGAPDGASFRGRGFIQLTGRANYARSGQAIGFGTQLVSNPLLAHDPAIAGKLLANYLKMREARLRGALFESDMVSARRLVNGGAVGLQPFSEAYKLCLSLLPKNLDTPGEQLVA